VLLDKEHIRLKDDHGVTRIVSNPNNLKSDKEIWLVIPGDKDLDVNSVSDSYRMFYGIDCDKPLSK
jgi:hypothetical protein